MITQNYENKAVKTFEIKNDKGEVIGWGCNDALSKEEIETLLNWLPESMKEKEAEK